MDTQQEIRLNIGGGQVELPGEWTVIDRKSGTEAYPLPQYADNSVSEIYASHVLEHFGHREAPQVLREWVRVLKPGGRLRVAVPDLDKIVEGYSKGEKGPWAGYLMGGQTDPNDYHKTVFNEERLTELMEAAGVRGTARWTSEVQDCASLSISLNLEGVKTGNAALLAKPFPKRRIVGVMSMPRLAFADNMFSALQTFTPLGIPFEKVTGAFWGQCLERVMGTHLNDGTDWIVTLDYDTYFTPQQFKALAVLMEEHPEADAIAPIQAKREEDTALFRPIDEQGNYIAASPEMFEPDLCRVGWAHFGLTMFRVSALRKMKHPWFLGVPNKDGEWGEGRVDDDIYFWQKWRETGNTLFLANHVCIGHMQLMATFVDQDLRVFHTHTQELCAKGLPANVRQ